MSAGTKIWFYQLPGYQLINNFWMRQSWGKHYMVAHHIVVQHKLIEHCVQRLVSSTHFSKLLFSVLSTPRLSLVSFYVLLCT